MGTFRVAGAPSTVLERIAEAMPHIGYRHVRRDDSASRVTATSGETTITARVLPGDDGGSKVVVTDGLALSGDGAKRVLALHTARIRAALHRPTGI